VKLLFVSGVYVPASGGSELSAHTLLEELVRRRHQVTVITGRRAEGSRLVQEEGGALVVRCSENELERTFSDVVRSMNPAVILTQLVWSERVMLWARQLSVPTVLFVRSADGEIDLSTDGPYAPTTVIANARITQEYIRRRWRREAFVVPPLIRLSDCTALSVGMHRYITMFNPTREKGGYIFRAVAEAMPQRQFLVVEGWHNWKNASGNWNVALLASAARGYGATSVKVPEIVDFSMAENVTCLPARSDVSSIYADTRVLLVPSLWPEPYARVIVEAMSNAIPVLYSGAGSTGEAADGAGVVIQPPTDPSAWVTAITELDDPAYYETLALRSLARARRYALHDEIDKAEAVIQETADKSLDQRNQRS
jgi:glycosyltransferase involved in cell wall biosynthesis